MCGKVYGNLEQNQQIFWLLIAITKMAPKMERYEVGNTSLTVRKVRNSFTLRMYQADRLLITGETLVDVKTPPSVEATLFKHKTVGISLFWPGPKKLIKMLSVLLAEVIKMDHVNDARRDDSEMHVTRLL